MSDLDGSLCISMKGGYSEVQADVNENGRVILN